jgi:type III secretion protein HrpB1
MSKLLFATPPGSVSIPAGTSKQLGTVDVTAYNKIRIVADERVGSGTGVVIRVTMTEGTNLVGQLDVISLAPHAAVTKVYDVPGSKLTLFADALAGSGTDGVDVLIYG